MRRRVDPWYSAPIAAVGVWWSRVGWWSLSSRKSDGVGGCGSAGLGVVWRLVCGLGLGVVVVVFGLSVSAAGAAAPAGGVLAFGFNEFAQLGSSANIGTSNPNPTPTVVGLSGEVGSVTQVAAGADHSLAVTASGLLYAFGINSSGELGSPANSGTESPNPTPTLVGLASGTTIDTVAQGEGADHSLVIVSDLTITTSALPAARAGSSYEAALTATGGTTPLAWSQAGLPSGLSIDPHTGVLAGTPTSAGSSQVTTTATDKYGNQTSHTYTLTINAAPHPPKPRPHPTAAPDRPPTPQTVTPHPYSPTSTNLTATGESSTPAPPSTTGRPAPPSPTR
jgi:Putative Ig domain/Regulator of chromosome condensation (RCC1) repeat